MARSSRRRGADNPLVSYSPTTTIIKLLFIVATSVFLVQLSLGWSLQETEKLTEFAFGAEYAMSAAWLIQLLPQVLLIIRVMVNDRKWERALLYAALAVNVVDASTNVSAYLSNDHLGSADWHPAIFYVGQAVGLLGAVAITWAEELLAYMVGTGLHLVAILLEKSGYRAPAWMVIGSDVAYGASAMRPVEELGQPIPVPTPAGRPAPPSDLGQPVRAPAPARMARPQRRH